MHTRRRRRGNSHITVTTPPGKSLIYPGKAAAAARGTSLALASSPAKTKCKATGMRGAAALPARAPRDLAQLPESTHRQSPGQPKIHGLAGLVSLAAAQM